MSKCCSSFLSKIHSSDSQYEEMSFCAVSYILVSTVYFYPLFIIFFKDKNVYWFGNRDVICFDQTPFLDLKVLNQVLQFLGCCHFWLTDWVLLRFKTWNDVWSGVTHGAAGFYPLSTRSFQNGKTHFKARLNVFFYISQIVSVWVYMCWLRFQSLMGAGMHD